MFLVVYIDNFEAFIYGKINLVTPTFFVSFFCFQCILCTGGSLSSTICLHVESMFEVFQVWMH